MLGHSLTCRMDSWCYGLEPKAACCRCGAGLGQDHAPHHRQDDQDDDEDNEPIMGPLTGYQYFLFNKYRR